MRQVDYSHILEEEIIEEELNEADKLVANKYRDETLAQCKAFWNSDKGKKSVRDSK